MKKILFIENTQRTRVWQWMADYLERKGCEVYWIVENHYYAPHGKHVYIIPYPNKKDILEAHEKGMPREIYDYIAFVDRNLSFFACKNADYYYYYYNEIKEYIFSIHPDIVIGESTQFHELLTICICKREGILFLHPSSCRYPVDRFSFYKYDTLETYGGSKEAYSYEQALLLANDIASRSTQPSYMIKPSFTWKKWMDVQLDKVIKAYSYYSGEQYCTPSIPRKFQLDRNKKRLVKRWDELAKLEKWDKRIVDKFVVMYPMQMQPEANLDVWGYPYKDQTKTIRLIAEQLKDDEVLIVKPNPKVKYELTDELVKLIQTHENIVNVPLTTPMSNVFAITDLVVVVTGTIAMECILSNKPVVTLAKTMNNKQRNCLYLGDLMELRTIINLAKNGEYVTITDDERVGYINEIVKTSYKGSPYSFSYDEGMMNALEDIIK